MARWSKATYEMVAKNIRNESQRVMTDVPGGEQSFATLQLLAQRFCNDFKQDNPEFKPDTFMRACGF